MDCMIEQTNDDDSAQFRLDRLEGVVFTVVKQDATRPSGRVTVEASISYTEAHQREDFFSALERLVPPTSPSLKPRRSPHPKDLFGNTMRRSVIVEGDDFVLNADHYTRRPTNDPVLGLFARLSQESDRSDGGWRSAKRKWCTLRPPEQPLDDLPMQWVMGNTVRWLDRVVPVPLCLRPTRPSPTAQLGVDDPRRKEEMIAYGVKRFRAQHFTRTFPSVWVTDQANGISRPASVSRHMKRVDAMNFVKPAEEALQPLVALQQEWEKLYRRSASALLGWLGESWAEGDTHPGSPIARPPPSQDGILDRTTLPGTPDAEARQARRRIVPIPIVLSLDDQESRLRKRLHDIAQVASALSRSTTLHLDPNVLDEVCEQVTQTRQGVRNFVAAVRASEGRPTPFLRLVVPKAVDPNSTVYQTAVAEMSDDAKRQRGQNPNIWMCSEADEDTGVCHHGKKACRPNFRLSDIQDHITHTHTDMSCEWDHYRGVGAEIVSSGWLEPPIDSDL